MAHTVTLKHAFEFPEGRFLISNDGGAYFLPDMHKTAYLAWGERKELAGKVCHALPTRAEDFKKYELTYEFEDGELLAARLISPRGRSKGVCAAKDVFNGLASALQTGALELRGKIDPPHIYRGAQFADGRMLLLAYNMPGSPHYSLLIGTPGDYKTLPTKTYLQGGSSFVFIMEDGTEIDLPSGLTGPNPHDKPTFGNELLRYVDLRNKTLEEIGVKYESPAPHLDPFCPELNKQAAPQPQWKPKGPQA
jgi:hypothetical protein